MKALAIFQRGELPQLMDHYPEPSVQNDDELLVSVKAAAIKHLDKSRAIGKHYSAGNDLSKSHIMGGDGVGLLADGTRVFALGASGMVAEKARIEKNTIVKLPDGIADDIAAALPNAVAGSAMALRFRAGIKEGETVLINGATGFTGKIAVQVARHYGAKKIIATGRNEKSLEQLRSLGANEIISLKQEDQLFVENLKRIHFETPIDIIIDYLWGHPAELILSALKGQGSFTHRSRFVSVGAMTADKIELSAESLRSADIHLTGSGLGSWTRDEMKILFKEIIPEMLELAAIGKLRVDTMKIGLSDIEKLWTMEVPDGKRIVVII